jgi:23S rRNA (uracil1939-C5)-methyltransferase
MSELVTFAKIVGEGKALGYLDGRACFVAGPLPGETARVEVIRSAARFVEAELVEVVEPSPRRGAAAEAHFRLCAPWQGVDYDYQLELKRGMLAEAMGRPELGLAVADMVAAPEVLGYRNKLEFALRAEADGRLGLAWHARRRADALVACPEGCALGSASMNAAAVTVLERLQALDVAGAATSLMVRQSRATGAGVAVIGLARAVRRDWQRLAGPELAGVVVARVRPGHRYDTLWTSGETDLTETVAGVAVTYPYSSFFQTNVPVFERALEQIVAAVPVGARVVDLYGGSGAIGLAVASRAGEVMGVEIDGAAVHQANANAGRAGLTNYRAVATAAEQVDPVLLDGADVVIVDPPRAGLDRRVVEALKAARPGHILYLSCNPVTQARDLMLLNEHYRPGVVTGFDFYPGTLHLESFVALERR